MTSEDWADIRRDGLERLKKRANASRLW